MSYTDEVQQAMTALLVKGGDDYRVIKGDYPDLTNHIAKKLYKLDQSIAQIKNITFFRNESIEGQLDQLGNQLYINYTHAVKPVGLKFNNKYSTFEESLSIYTEYLQKLNTKSKILAFSGPIASLVDLGNNQYAIISFIFQEDVSAFTFKDSEQMQKDFKVGNLPIF